MSETAQAYPLQWPVSTPRTRDHNRKRSAFGERNWDTTIHELRHELDLLGASAITLSTNQPIRRDGNPYASPRNMDDPGVAVYFRLNGNSVCLPCDRWLSIGENLRAVTLHVAAMRGMNRWGVGRANQVFDGYKALPATTEENWWDVLNISPSADLAVIERAFRVRALEAHPDRNNGDATRMTRLNLARDRARATLVSTLALLLVLFCPFARAQQKVDFTLYAADATIRTLDITSTYARLNDPCKCFHEADPLAPSSRNVVPLAAFQYGMSFSVIEGSRKLSAHGHPRLARLGLLVDIAAESYTVQRNLRLHGATPHTGLRLGVTP